jgi:hypothetical protein
MFHVNREPNGARVRDMDKARKALLLAMVVVGAASCALRFYLNMTGHPEHTPLWRLVEYLSYFTNTTALLATAVATLALMRPASKLAQPGAVTATAVYSVVVAVTYEWLLSTETHGLDRVSNLGLHQVLPLLAVLLWLTMPKAGLNWRAPLAWLVYPAVYMLCILGRGAVMHRYPYFFADVDKLGYPRTVLNGVVFLLVFYLLGLGAVALANTKMFSFRFGPKTASPEA